MSNKFKNLTWPDLMRSLHDKFFTNEQGYVWEEVFTDELNSLPGPDEIKRAIHDLRKCRDMGRDRSRPVDAYDIVTSIRKQRNQDSRLDKKSSVCFLCRDTGWMSYPIIWVDDQSHIADGEVIPSKLPNGQLVDVMDYGTYGISSIPCVCAKGTSYAHRSDATAQQRQHVAHWIQDQPECSKFSTRNNSETYDASKQIKGKPPAIAGTTIASELTGGF